MQPRSSDISAYYEVCFFQQLALWMTVIMKITFVLGNESKCSFSPFIILYLPAATAVDSYSPSLYYTHPLVIMMNIK